MEKIFICLADWALPFEYDGDQDCVIKSKDEKFDLQIRKSDDYYGLDLYIENERVDILSNSAKEKNLIKKIDEYFQSKVEETL